MVHCGGALLQRRVLRLFLTAGRILVTLRLRSKMHGQLPDLPANWQASRQTPGRVAVKASQLAGGWLFCPAGRVEGLRGLGHNDQQGAAVCQHLALLGTELLGSSTFVARGCRRAASVAVRI